MADKTAEPPKPNNMELWDRLKRTDPNATKPFDRGTFKGTQIDPYFRYQMMTEVFGPCGKGWGYELTDPIITDGLVFVGAKVWYIDLLTKEKFWSSMQYGGDALTKGKGRVNDEAMKMAVTDAVGKALSLLGLGADIYMGQFDDSKYREESAALYAAKAAGWTKEAVAAFEKETGKRVGECDTLETLDELWHTEAKEKLIEIGKFDDAAKKRIVGLFSARKSLIQQALNGDGEEEKTDPEENPAQKQMVEKEAKDTLPTFQILKGDDGVPKWGILHKSIKNALKLAGTEKRTLAEIQHFWKRHSKAIKQMHDYDGGKFKEYATDLKAKYLQQAAEAIGRYLLVAQEQNIFPSEVHGVWYDNAPLLEQMKNANEGLANYASVIEDLYKETIAKLEAVE